MSAVILCVEDEAGIRSDIVGELELEGYTVFQAANGHEALDAFDAVTPDLVLCDIRMPGLSGYDVLTRLRQSKGAGRSVPFVFLTAYGERTDQVAARRLGADDFLLKPVDFDLMLATVESRLRNVQSLRDRFSAQIEDLEEKLRERSRPLVAGPDADLTTFVAAELPRAIAGNQLRLYLQPKIRIPHGAVVGAEALLRWVHPERGAISPADFVPAAERAGLAPALGAWVMEHAVQAAALLQAQNLPLKVSFNVSAKDLDPTLADHLRHQLQRRNLSPALLEVEITETSAAADPLIAIESARAIRALGVSVAVDDFGTGYASLSYLRDFPVDTLKIDQSFVRSLKVGTADHCIVENIMALSRSMSLDIVAEGVETTEQMTLLSNLGCHVVQGYLYSPALPLELFTDFALKKISA